MFLDDVVCRLLELASLWVQGRDSDIEWQPQWFSLAVGLRRDCVSLINCCLSANFCLIKYQNEVNKAKLAESDRI